jgi:hypothetical protein
MNTTNASKHKRVKFSQDTNQPKNHDDVVIINTATPLPTPPLPPPPPPPTTTNIPMPANNVTLHNVVMVPMTAAQQKLCLITMQTLCNVKRTFDVNNTIEIRTRLNALRLDHARQAERLNSLTFKEMIALVQSDIMGDFVHLSNMETNL